MDMEWIDLTPKPAFPRSRFVGFVLRSLEIAHGFYE